MAKLDLNLSIFNHVSLKEKVFMSRQLSTMLSAGLAIDQSFKVLSSQTKNDYLKKVFAQVIAELEGGQSLSSAMARFPKVFDPVFIAVVRSGESSGQLDKVLLQLADRLEMDQDFETKIKTAMFYPIFVIISMIAIIIVMMVYVVPQLKTVFTESNLELPWTTQAVVSISDFTVKYWWLELIAALILALLMFVFFRTENGGSVWDRIKIRIPVFKELFVEIYMARFCRTMSMLIKAGLPIMETLAISADVVQNRIYTRSFRLIAAQVERGVPISVPMQKDKNFPPIVTQMIMVGEQTGKLESVLTKMADYYENETNAMIKGLSGLIEPIIIVIIGGGVGFLVYSIIQPIYSIAQVGF